MDIAIADLRSRIEQHLAVFAQQMDANAVGCIRQFADWLEGKQAEEAKEKEAVDFLHAHGYTVTK